MKRIRQNPLLTGSLCALGAETLYGLSYLFTRQATQTAGAFALLGWRFLVAAVIMRLLVRAGLVRIRIRGRPLRPLLLVAFFSPCVYFIGETAGIARTTASESGVFLACIPVASLIASACILREKPTRRQVAGILLTLLGVLITVLAVGASSSLSATGYACLLAAVVSYALYSVFVEKAAAYTGTEITYVMLAVGAAFFVSLAVGEALIRGTAGALLTLPFRQPAFLAAMLYQGVGCSIAAFFLSNMAIARIGVNRASSFIGAATVVSILAGALVLGEPFTAAQAAGALAILAGVYTANA